MKRPKKLNRECPEWSNLIDWLVYSIYLYAAEYGAANEGTARCIIEADYRYYVSSMRHFEKACSEAIAICRKNAWVT